MNDNFHDGSETRNQKLVEKYIMANKLHRMYAEGNSQPPACVHGNDCSLPEEDGKGRIYQPRDG